MVEKNFPGGSFGDNYRIVDIPQGKEEKRKEAGRGVGFVSYRRLPFRWDAALAAPGLVADPHKFGRSQ